MRRRLFSRSATGLAASFIALGIAASPAGASGTRSIRVEFGTDEATHARSSSAVVSLGKLGRLDATETTATTVRTSVPVRFDKPGK